MPSAIAALLGDSLLLTSRQHLSPILPFEAINPRQIGPVGAHKREMPLHDGFGVIEHYLEDTFASQYLPRSKKPLVVSSTPDSVCLSKSSLSSRIHHAFFGKQDSVIAYDGTI